MIYEHKELIIVTMIIIPDNLFYLIYIKYTYNKYLIIMKFVKQGKQL